MPLLRFPVLRVASWLCFASILTSALANETPLPDLIRTNFQRAQVQYTDLLQAVGEDSRLPRSTDQGKLKLVKPDDWTSGFFPGALWFVFEYTQEPTWKQAAEKQTQKLEAIRHYSGDHDVGFMLGCSYGQGYRLTQNPAYKAVLLDGANALATRFRPGAGIIRSWDFGPWLCPVIIDNMMNLELLLWAEKNGGPARLREIAVSHANVTLQHHFRPDASSFHLVDYDPESGAVLKKQTVQGLADPSAWARGQSWGLYGYTVMYRETRDTAYLTRAQTIADFLLAHPNLPADKVPYWDYNAPAAVDTPRDTSAAAIMASALLELSDFVDAPRRATYRALATQQLRSLSSAEYLSPAGKNHGFLLQHGVGHIPGKHEIDVALIYGDYYFLEALLRLQARLHPSS